MLRAILREGVGQGDIAPSAVLHIPSLDAVVAGDVAYNQIHQMLALGGPAEWDKWIASIGIIERLHPRIVVVGHKKPEAPDDEAEKILNGAPVLIFRILLRQQGRSGRWKRSLVR